MRYADLLKLFDSNVEYPYKSNTFLLDHQVELLSLLVEFKMRILK